MTNARNLLWKLRRHLVVADDVQALSVLLGRTVTHAEVERLFVELADADELRETLDSPEARRWTSDSKTRTLSEQLLLDGVGRGRALFLYAATRLAQPAIAIETGCFTGWDSALVLAALARNGSGHLWSIDLPAREGRFSQLPGPHGSALPEGLEPGFLIPDALRDRWTLVLGNVRDELAPLLDEVGDVGLFYHDSDHTYEHMIWEYATVWPHLTPGGLLLSDDISWNTSFWDFAAGVGAQPVVHRATSNVGGIRASNERARRARSTRLHEVLV